MVEEMRKRIEQTFATRIFVDTGPVLEKSFRASNNHWLDGEKYLCNSTRSRFWLFLGEILTTLEIAHDISAADVR